MKSLFLLAVIVVLVPALALTQDKPSSSAPLDSPSFVCDAASFAVSGNVEVLNDTQGVNLGPYLSEVVKSVRMNWNKFIPGEAWPPVLKQGKVSIELAILPTGTVRNMVIVSPSGEIGLDRAAWGRIVASIPFGPLPQEFHGPYLTVRFNFSYKPSQ